MLPDPDEKPCWKRRLTTMTTDDEEISEKGNRKETPWPRGRLRALVEAAQVLRQYLPPEGRRITAVGLGLTVGSKR